MKVYVGGINGSGKTTILKEVAKQLGFEYIQLTHLMMEALGFPFDYDKLRITPEVEKTKVREEILAKLLSDNDRNIIIDSHYLNLIKGKTNIVNGPAIAKFDILVLISAPVEQIWQRIYEDQKTRDRALFPDNFTSEESFQMLTKYQEDTAQEFSRLASTYHKKNIEIINVDGELESSIAKLVNFIGQS